MSRRAAARPPATFILLLVLNVLALHATAIADRVAQAARVPIRSASVRKSEQEVDIRGERRRTEARAVEHDPVSTASASRRLQGGCDDLCHYPADGICDDGGEGSTYDVCPLGSDCTDCGLRVASPPSPFGPSQPPGPPPPHVYSQLELSGQLCPSLSAAGGIYTLQGTVGNGAPYYTNAAGYWLYHDLDCGGNGWQPAAWILDNGMLDASRSSNLNVNGLCMYKGERMSSDMQPPMGTQMWRLTCGSSITFADLTLTAASGAPPAAPLPPTVPPPPVYHQLVVSGLCFELAGLDGNTYTLQGRTGIGAPYYANAAGRSLYYDLDCGGSGYPARWILSNAAPDASRSFDLDNDGQCAYVGDLLTADAQLPLGTHRWDMNCDGSWTSVDLTLAIASPSPPPAPPVAPSPPFYREVVVSGMCPSGAAYGGTYTLQGMTGNGAPYYANAVGRSLYYDLDCAGSGLPARWILDDSPPDASRSFDLDNDGQCSFAGHLLTADAQLPLGTHAWALVCDGSWPSVDLTLAIASPSMPPVSPITSPSPPPSTPPSLPPPCPPSPPPPTQAILASSSDELALALMRASSELLGDPTQIVVGSGEHTLDSGGALFDNGTVASEVSCPPTTPWLPGRRRIVASTTQLSINTFAAVVCSLNPHNVSSARRCG